MSNPNIPTPHITAKEGDFARTVSAGLALYLVGSSGAAKDKVLGKLRGRVGDASRINGHDDPIV